MELRLTREEVKAALLEWVQNKKLEQFVEVEVEEKYSSGVEGAIFRTKASDD